MDEGSRIYLPWDNLPIHTATLPCQPGLYDVMPFCNVAPGRLIASRICSILVRTDTAGDLSSTARQTSPPCPSPL